MTGRYYDSPIERNEDCMATTPETIFHYEVVTGEDENKWKLTTITCHGRLVNDTADQIKDVSQASDRGRRSHRHRLRRFEVSGQFLSGSVGWPEGVGDQQRILQVGTRQLVAPYARSIDHHKPDRIVLSIKVLFHRPDEIDQARAANFSAAASAGSSGTDAACFFSNDRHSCSSSAATSRE